MIASIHQPNYFPRAKVISKAVRSDIFVYLDDVQYVTREWQNRCLVKDSANVAHWLTIPILTKGKRHQLIEQALIDHTRQWEHKHMATIHHFFARSPFFDTTFAACSDVWQEQEQRLAPVCYRSTDSVLSLLNCHVPRVRASSLVSASAQLARATGNDRRDELTLAPISKSARRTARIIDICKDVNASGYLSGTGGMSYLDVAAFERAGLNLFVQADMPENIGWQNFSVLDWLMRFGPDYTAETLVNHRIIKVC